MTLAADGHLVKVHKVLMALSSPYIKELITSAPCQHPVIFLNNVSYTVMCLLLEYIYTGEVMIPPESLTSFMEAAKSLHINGLEKINSYKKSMESNNEDVLQIADIESNPTDAEGHDVSNERRQYLINSESQQVCITSSAELSEIEPSQLATYDDAIQDDDSVETDSDDNVITSQIHNKKREDPQKSNLQFCVSNKGTLQIILNRYVYSLSYTRVNSDLRRWRCVERNKKCSAFVITKGNIAIKRQNLHNHPFHDKKILNRIARNAVYSVMDDIETVSNKNKEKK